MIQPFNLLALEPAILARLREQITDIEIGSTAALAGALDITKLCPFIFVAPDESDVGDTRQGRVSIEEQVWIVTLVAATIPDKRLKDVTYQEAGEGLGQIYLALRGWTPAAGFKPMEYAGRPKPHHDLGWSAFPMAFRCGAILR